MRSATYRLYPTAGRGRALEKLLEVQRQLYNAAFEERRGAWKWERRALTRYDQYNGLTGAKEWCPELARFGRRLRVRNMTRSAQGTVEAPGTNVGAKASLNRTILDAGWGQLANLLTYKAEGAGRELVRVARHTSQTCARCGAIDPASRPDRDHFACTTCGHSIHPDANAAQVILSRAMAGSRVDHDEPGPGRATATQPGRLRVVKSRNPAVTREEDSYTDPETALTGASAFNILDQATARAACRDWGFSGASA